MDLVLVQVSIFQPVLRSGYGATERDLDVIRALLQVCATFWLSRILHCMLDKLGSDLVGLLSGIYSRIASCTMDISRPE